MQTLESSNRSFTLPNYARDGFKPLREPNFAKNVTLGGRLYVDFFNERGGWEIEFDTISRSEYEQFKALYRDQFADREFLRFSDESLGIYDEEVFLNLPASEELVWDKTVYRDFVIVLDNRFATEFSGGS